MLTVVVVVQGEGPEPEPGVESCDHHVYILFDCFRSASKSSSGLLRGESETRSVIRGSAPLTRSQPPSLSGRMQPLEFRRPWLGLHHDVENNITGCARRIMIIGSQRRNPQ